MSSSRRKLRRLRARLGIGRVVEPTAPEVSRRYRYGLIIPTATDHAMRRESIASARLFSDATTPVVILFNGTEPCEVPEGVTVVHLPERFDDEADLWQWCLDYAVEHGWDWCMVHHDDFAMMEAGWEDEIEASYGWRVAIAGHYVYSQWNEQATSGGECLSHIGVVHDPMSQAFNVKVFVERGCVIEERQQYGYGAWDACGWALENDYAIWRIFLSAKHQWRPGNTRTVFGLGAPGHQAIAAKYNGRALPARVIDPDTIFTAGRVVRVAPEGVNASNDPRAGTVFLSNASYFHQDESGEWVHG